MNVEDTVYLTARSEDRGRAAVHAVGITKAHQDFAQLDVTDTTSIASLAAHLKDKQGGVGIVASNHELHAL